VHEDVAGLVIRSDESEAFGVVDTHASVIPAWLGYVNSMWRAVFYFLPAMVAYNASKKLDIDPWVGTAVILSLLTPNFIGLSNASSFTETTCTTTALGSEQCVTQIGSLPLQLSDYGGPVLLPLPIGGIPAPPPLPLKSGGGGRCGKNIFSKKLCYGC